LEYGAVITESCEEFPIRLKKIYDGYMELFEKYKPEAVAIEELFYNKNVKQQ